MELQHKEVIVQKHKEWVSVGASIRKNEIDLFNKQLDNLRCETLKDLCSLLIAGKLRIVTDDEQVQIMKAQTQSTGLLTSQIGDKFNFWKQIDDEDFHKWLLAKYHPHTANCLHSYYISGTSRFSLILILTLNFSNALILNVLGFCKQ